MTITALALTACMPSVHPPGEVGKLPQLTNRAFLASDGAVLPVRSWLPQDNPLRAVIIALHGFNDYSNFFAAAGEYLCRLGIGSYAFDQRGFGAAPKSGLWPGISAFVNDTIDFTRQVKKRHPSTPVYLLGESMGGAVVIVAMSGSDPSAVDGVILAAPAVWGRITMPWYQRTLLWLTAHTIPWMTVSGEGMEIRPSDNIDMLRELGRDPLVIKDTRIDTLYGLVDLMDAALVESAGLRTATLLLYGERDEVIPKAPTYAMLKTLPPQRDKGNMRLAFYENGFHMLLRDLEAETLWTDIAAWIESPEKRLPSGAELRAKSKLQQMDRQSAAGLTPDWSR